MNGFIQPVVQVSINLPCPAAAKLPGHYRRSEFLLPLVLVFYLHRGFKMVPRGALRQTRNISLCRGESLHQSRIFFQEHLILQEALASCSHHGSQGRCMVLFAWLRHLSLFKQLSAMPHTQVWSTTALMRNTKQSLMLHSMYSMNCSVFEILPKKLEGINSFQHSLFLANPISVSL